MFEIVLPIATMAGRVGFARARGARPWVRGTLAVAGYFLVPFSAKMFALFLGAEPRTVRGDAQFRFFISALGWIALLAFCTRFLLGRTREKPSGRCSCSNCRSLQQQYAVICEACQQPYGESAPWS